MKSLFIFLFFLPLTLFSQENDYISNKDYNEFVIYVRDSLLRKTMGEEVDEEYYLKTCYTCHEGYIPSIKWKSKLDINSPEAREALEPWYYKLNERLNRKREFDTRKFIHNGVKVYPDELIWCRNSTINKSWGIFLAKYYYTHSYFEDYPVQGVSREQLKQYMRWKYPRGDFKNITDSIETINLFLPKEKLQFTIGDYFKFYKYTRDSIVLLTLGEEINEEKYLISENNYGEKIDPAEINMDVKIKWEDELILKTLKANSTLNSNNEIDNRYMNYIYEYFNYYKAITYPDLVDRVTSINRIAINVYNENLFETFSPIDIKKQLKDKTEANYSSFLSGQIKAFYHWKKNKYPKEDVFDGFILEESDLELLRNGKLTDEFYSFKKSISTILIK